MPSEALEGVFTSRLTFESYSPLARNFGNLSTRVLPWVLCAGLPAFSL